MKKTYFKSPIGYVVIAASPLGVEEISFSRFEPAFESDEDDLSLRQALVELQEYFFGKRKTFSFPLNLKGSEFQRDVWKALREIPCGNTCSYADIAKKVGKKGGARAVGQAVGANPVPVLVPCHRVIAQGGKLGGFSAGIDRKKWLLQHEQSHFGLERGFGLAALAASP